MDTTRPIIYRSVNANDVVKTPDGMAGSMIQRASYAGIRGVGYSEKRALTDGRLASDVFLDGRNISLDGVMNALTRGDLFDRLQRLIAAFTPTGAYAESPGDKGYLPLYFYFPTDRVAEFGASGEMECFIRARPLAQPDFIIDRDKIGGDDNQPLAIPWSVALQAIDPRIYIMPRKDTPATASGSARLVNRGTYPAPLNAMFIVPPAAGTVTITLTGGGAAMTLTIPNDPLARTVRVSATDRVITSQLGTGVETLAWNYFATNADINWPSIPPGYADIVWTASHALSAGSILWFYESLV